MPGRQRWRGKADNPRDASPPGATLEVGGLLLRGGLFPPCLPLCSPSPASLLLWQECPGQSGYSPPLWSWPEKDSSWEPVPADPKCRPLLFSLPPDPLYISEYSSQGRQALIGYSWYGDAKLFHFRVPEDTVKLRWLLQMHKGRGFGCKDTVATIHFRYSAPPVINPLGQKFHPDITARLSYNLTVPLGTDMENPYLNLTNPAAGDWFIAAHLPKAAGTLQIKGIPLFCSYSFEPNMFVLRVANPLILQPNTTTQQRISWPANVLHAKIFVPAFSTQLRFNLESCTVSTSAPCRVRVTLGSTTLVPSSQKKLDCTGPCDLLLTSPPWETWMQISVETFSGAKADVDVELATSLTVCKPTGSVSYASFRQSLDESQSAEPLSPSNASSTLQGRTGDPRALGKGSKCFDFRPVYRDEFETVFARFRVSRQTSTVLQGETPALVFVNLDSILDSGGMLVLKLSVHTDVLAQKGALVWACLSRSAPVLPLDATPSCRTDFSEGYLLTLSVSSSSGSLVIPYPESAYWYLSLQLMCPGGCADMNVRVYVYMIIQPCYAGCGEYGYCSLLRHHGYVYTACICKVGWGGWTCSDDSAAQTVGRQLLATLLLTLSNLFFLPTIAIALYHYHLIEALVYTFTMFFSTFYHACDQPGVAVWCIMKYDTLQFCDFLGSVASIWVTILCMARLKENLKYILCLMGILIISMLMQQDRKGAWNLLGPCIVGLTILTSVWTYRSVTRKRCYPPCWKRWAFFLIPGICMAFIGILIFALFQTKENYYYTHSIWHVLIATSGALLLPPGVKHMNPCAWSCKNLCNYQICKNNQEELVAVP